MFEEIRRVFRQSVAAFREELSHREPEDQVAELLMAMRRELVAARAAIPEIEAHLASAQAELARERAALERCERHGELAERIGDAETVRVAAEFAARHRERARVLARKVEAAEADLDLHRREAEEMRRRYQEADANRFGLVAQLRRGRARGGNPGVAREDRAFADLGRMEERVEGAEAYVDALGELDEPPSRSPGDPSEVEDRLKELKRRLGKE